MRNAILTTAVVLATATPAVAALPAPERTVTAGRSHITATFTAPAAGVYTLDSTYFTLGLDPWGRIRATQLAAAGGLVSLRVACLASRGLYGYRILTPDGTAGPATWVKCQ